MGGCKSKCFEFSPTEVSIIAPGDYDCNLSSIMTLTFTPGILGPNGTLLVYGDNVLMATIYFNNNTVSQINPESFITYTKNDTSYNLTITSKIPGLTEGVNYILGDNYKILYLDYAFACANFPHGTYIVFSRISRELSIQQTTPQNNTISIVSLILLVVILLLLIGLILLFIFKY